MTTARARTAGPFLDKATLVRAAADLADRDGWSRLTLSKAAEAVDRHVSSLYTHVDGLDGLRREVALLSIDELADDVWRAAIGRSGGDALTAIATVERDFARAHPGRISAIFAFSSTADPEFRARGARLAEPIRATFTGFGLDPDQAATAHQVFSAAVRGLSRSDAEPDSGRPAPDDALTQTVQLFVTALGTGTWPERS